jgi:dTDP-L-rhamnose 4-epimerase
VISEDGTQSRDFTHVSDIVQANLLAMAQQEIDYGVFNVGTGCALTILDMAEALIEHLNSPVEPEIVNKFRASDIRHCFADISRLQQLGYQPRVRFEDGGAELVDWARSQETVDKLEQARRELTGRGLTS